MDHGLSENFPDRMSPVQLHTDALARLGATTGSLGHGINSITSDVIKVCNQPFRIWNDDLMAVREEVE